MPIRERLPLLEQLERPRITSGDATLSRIGAVDWKAEEVKRYKEALGQVLAEVKDEYEIISIMELLEFVVLACHRRSVW